MDIKLKHSPKKCWACKRQAMLNRLCRGEDFGIEFDFFKNRGDIIPLISYTAKKLEKGGSYLSIPLQPMFEVQEYVRGTAIDLIPPLSESGAKFLVNQAIGSFLENEKQLTNVDDKLLKEHYEYR